MGEYVRAEGVGVRIDELWLFRDLSFEVDAGECLVLSGVNGSGKSTLLRCLYGIQQHTEGTLAVAGSLPDERSVAFRRQVSVLLDDSDTFPELTARQHVELLLGGFGGELGQVDELLADAGLGERAEVTAGRLSAGQNRRLLLVGATARPHEVLLLDEPERALDVAGKDWVSDLVTRAKQGGSAVIVASHHRPLVDKIADYVLDLG